MRRSNVAQQLAELDLLFPHAGQHQQSLEAVPAQQSRNAQQLVHDRRQIDLRRVEAPPFVGRVLQDRRQIVGAYTEEPDGGDESWKELGLPLTGTAGISIAFGQSADFELKPNRLFLPGILSIDPTIAPQLIMTSLTIGGNNCLLSNGAIPMVAFSTLALHKPFRAWSASNAQPITFTLKNIHASLAALVYGVWWGLAQV